jgi:hypothetical protein
LTTPYSPWSLLLQSAGCGLLHLYQSTRLYNSQNLNLICVYSYINRLRIRHSFPVTVIFRRGTRHKPLCWEKYVIRSRYKHRPWSGYLYRRFVVLPPANARIMTLRMSKEVRSISLQASYLTCHKPLRIILFYLSTALDQLNTEPPEIWDTETMNYAAESFIARSFTHTQTCNGYTTTSARSIYQNRLAAAT